MLIFLNTIGALQLFIEPLILNNYFETAVHHAQLDAGRSTSSTPRSTPPSTTWAPRWPWCSALVIVAISVTSLLFRRPRGCL